MKRRTILLAVLLTACAPSAPPRFAQASAAAERAYVHGRYADAATLWSRAAAVAESGADRAEANYRSAAALMRAGAHGDARALLERLARGTSARAARAAFDLAALDRKDGNSRRSASRLDELIRRHPESAAAARAVELRLHELSDDDEAAATAYLRRLDADLGRTPLGERIGYELARSLERGGDRSGAVTAYRRVAAEYPYPRGALWDDALYSGARLEAELGHPKQAVELLEHMLSHRESAALQGSYERPRYANARFTIAELYRDSLGQPERARDEFLKLWRSHPTSILRDDAKWEAALIARARGDDEAACRDASDLQSDAPDSRYVGCLYLVCPRAKSGETSCHEYIRRRVDGASATR